MKYAIYDSVCHIDDNKLIVIPTGMDKATFQKRLTTEKVIPSGKFTKSGREYCNFAPMIGKAEIEFTTLAELESAL